MAKPSKPENPESGHLNLAEEALSAEEQHLAFIRQIGRTFLSLASDRHLVVYDNEAGADLISATVWLEGHTLRGKNPEGLNSSERQLVLFKMHDSDLYRANKDPGEGGWLLSAPEQDIVNSRTPFLKPISPGEQVPPTQITGILLRGNDHSLSHLVEHVELTDEQRRLAFSRGGPQTRKTLMNQNGSRLSARECQMVLDDADDEAIAIMLRLPGQRINKQQRQQALAIGGYRTLTEMAQSGRLRARKDRLVALVNGNSQVLKELVCKYKLDEDELILAAYKGNHTVLTAIVDEQRQRLTPRLVTLIRAIATKQRLSWVLSKLDKESEPAES